MALAGILAVVLVGGCAPQVQSGRNEPAPAKSAPTAPAPQAKAPENVELLHDVVIRTVEQVEATLPTLKRVERIEHLAKGYSADLK
jgi:hypothetical protein